MCELTQGNRLHSHRMGFRSLLHNHHILHHILEKEKGFSEFNGRNQQNAIFFQRKFLPIFKYSKMLKKRSRIFEINSGLILKHMRKSKKFFRKFKFFLIIMNLLIFTLNLEDHWLHFVFLEISPLLGKNLSSELPPPKRSSAEKSGAGFATANTTTSSTKNSESLNILNSFLRNISSFIWFLTVFLVLFLHECVENSNSVAWLKNHFSNRVL